VPVYSTAVRRPMRLALFATFAATGVSALILQVVWQRVLSLHAGVDLLAATTVVTAFMAGLGLGSLAGGALADRLGPRASLLAFALSNAGLGAYAWSSLWLFYDVYRRYAERLDGAVAMVAFHFLLLVVPTTLMGLSLPLLARGVVASAAEIAPRVGRLYAVNTLGAAAGAALAGWWLMGEYGFVAAVRVAASLNLAAAAVVFAMWARLRRHPQGRGTVPVSAAGEQAGSAPTPGAGPERSPAGDRAASGWFLLYGLTGAVAIGLEVVYFRIIDAVMRNNSYTFATVLAMYLLLFALGAALGARWAGRLSARPAARPDLWFLTLQFTVGASALWGLALLVRPPRAFGIAAFAERYYGTDGFLMGYTVHGMEDVARLLYVHVAAPLLVMGAPVLLMGASFPFLQAVVARRLDSLGRRTGMLLFANICGNVAGGALTGFVLLERLGTAATLRILAGALLLPGLLAAARLSTPRRRAAGVLSAAAIFALGALAVPPNRRLWAFFHSAPLDRFELDEDRACVTSLVERGDETFLYINASWQNGHPYDTFHILIGLLPTLAHPEPRRGLAVGLGIGSTAYSLAQHPVLDRVDCVEICGGEKRLIARLGARGSLTSRRLVEDPRVRLIDGDGRRFLLAGGEPYDVIVVDAVRPNTAYAGNLYSIEFYQLVKSRLAPGGVFVQWVPTGRVLNSVLTVFPNVSTTIVPDYFGSSFLVASQEQLPLDGDTLRRRFAALDLTSSFSPEQIERLEAFFGQVGFERVPHRRIKGMGEHLFNRDLFPRDEYFLNNEW
jgi:spermidine synthase